MAFVPKPPKKAPAGASSHALQSAEEKSAAAHNAFKLLWKKVKAHSEWTDHVQKRDASLQRARASSATRATTIRGELAAGKELLQKELEAHAAEQSKRRARVLKKEETLAEEKDVRLRALNASKHKKKKAPPTQEELDEVAKAWVTVGRGGYNFSELDSARYQRAMLKAEMALKKDSDAQLLEQKRRLVMEMRHSEALKLQHLQKHHPARVGSASSSTPRKSELAEKDAAALKAAEEALQATMAEDDPRRGRKLVPGVEGALLPDFHKAEEKRARVAENERRWVLAQKTDAAQKQAKADIDAAAKLLILHAHMLRQQCLAASAAVKAAESGGGGEDAAEGE